MNTSDSEFIEKESRQEHLRQQLLIHELTQLHMLIHAFQQTCILAEEFALVANVFEKAGVALRDEQEKRKQI